MLHTLSPTDIILWPANEGPDICLRDPAELDDCVPTTRDIILWPANEGPDICLRDPAELDDCPVIPEPVQVISGGRLPRVKPKPKPKPKRKKAKEDEDEDEKKKKKEELVPIGDIIRVLPPTPAPERVIIPIAEGDIVALKPIPPPPNLKVVTGKVRGRPRKLASLPAMPLNPEPRPKVEWVDFEEEMAFALLIA
jgi:hypothetical protein